MISIMLFKKHKDVRHLGPCLFCRNKKKDGTGGGVSGTVGDTVQCTVYLVGGFSMEKYVSAKTCADFIVSTPDYFRYNSADEFITPNRSERSQQTQRPVFPARDMLCENPHICG